ncbi:MAG: ASKHA domain-containing protein [Coriobacteriales bacterium]|jgi:uncharacterized 2Fe-2S/4Fe-4S cluster protein (DUF4445 family)|nr:ASKHA domain-containing protein [Coriobacteriales bacterium]
MSESYLKVVFPKLNLAVKADCGDNLLELIREAGIGLDASCGGVGRCGKCRVVIDGVDHLACTTHVVRDLEVLIPAEQTNEGYAILVDHESAGERSAGGTQGDTRTYAIAIDIGTTTVVGKLIDLATGREHASFAQLNTQIPYGADVVSRIDASLDDASTLSNLLTGQIDKAVASLLAEHRIDKNDVRKLVLAGNTTMSYLLLGLPCRSLGLAPFKPAFVLKDAYAYRDVFHTDTLYCNCEVVPYISAFVGGDITSGLVALRGEDDFILMDMGTNGELVFKRGERLICTATATGPAFEGGTIECGCGSTRGAISALAYEGGGFRYQTIGAAPASGICGSGILDLMAILVREGMVDKTGFLTDALGDERGRIVLTPGSPETGNTPVFFTQKDVRQYQLAKGAVRAGLEVLMHEMGGDPPSKVFLAGGFGQNLNPESALATGLLPKDFRGRVTPIGNSSLSGAVKLCLNASAREDVATLQTAGEEINLATHRRFNDLFMESMSF